MIKYPFNSQYLEEAKFGYFESEKEIIDSLKMCGTFVENHRNPLSLILEAADDISYYTADLEDAINKGLINFETFQCMESSSDCIVKDFFNNIKNYYMLNKSKKRNCSNQEIFKKTMRSIIADLKQDLIKETAQKFKDEKIIFEGVIYNNDPQIGGTN